MDVFKLTTNLRSKESSRIHSLTQQRSDGIYKVSVLFIPFINFCESTGWKTDNFHISALTEKYGVIVLFKFQLSNKIWIQLLNKIF